MKTALLSLDSVIVPANHVHTAFLAALKTYGQVMSLEETISALSAE
jgi:hypothetical protein